MESELVIHRGRCLLFSTGYHRYLYNYKSRHPGLYWWVNLLIFSCIIFVGTPFCRKRNENTYFSFILLCHIYFFTLYVKALFYIFNTLHNRQPYLFRPRIYSSSLCPCHGKHPIRKKYFHSFLFLQKCFVFVESINFEYK